MEKYSSTRHALGLYNNVSVTAYYSKPEAERLDRLRSIVFGALATVIQQHPVLSAIPVDEELPTAHFVHLPAVDLNRAVTFVERTQVYKADGQVDEELDRVLERQHNTNFKDGLGDCPYWRLIVLHHPSIPSHFAASFVFHHALADGGSGLAFHRAFHAALLALDKKTISTADTPAAAQPSITALVPSLEEMHPLPLTIWFVLVAIWGSIFPMQTARLWTGPSINFSHRQRRLRTVVVSAHNTSAIVQATRAQGSSLTAVIPVLLAIAVFSNLDAEQFEVVRASIPISLRHILPADRVTLDTIGVYVSQTQSDYRRSDLLSSLEGNPSTQGIWAAAKATKASLSSGVARKGRNEPAGMLRWAGPLKEYMEQKQGKQPESSFEFSNIGAFKYAVTPGEEDWRVERMVFGQDGNIVGPVFQTAGASGPDGSLTVTFAWLDGQLEEEWICKVMLDFEKQVAALATSESQTR